jgi:hypothetical protein
MAANIRRSIHRILDISIKIEPTDYLLFKKFVSQIKDEPTLKLLKEYLTLPTHRRGDITINGFNEYKRRKSIGQINEVIITNTQNTGYTNITHPVEIKKMKREAPNKYYIHEVIYYIDNEPISQNGYIQKWEDDEGEMQETRIKNYSISYKSSNINKQLIDKILFDTSLIGTNTSLWYPQLFFKTRPSRKKVIIRTTAYDPVFVTYPQLQQISQRQIYRDNESKTCIYDGIVEYLNYLIDKNDNDRYAKGALNKLIENETEYKKEYTDDDIHTIGAFIGASITIKDLINGNDKHFNINSFNRFNIVFINTRFHHLDITFNINNVKEVDDNTYNNIKERAKFYIETMGTLTIIKNKEDKDGQEHIKYNSYRREQNDFNEIFNEYRNTTQYDSLYLNKNSQARDLIGTYDYNLHKFFDKKMILDNNLYEEIDQKLCYYNVLHMDKNIHFVGLPSGSFYTFKNENNEFNIDTFDIITRNKMIGFFHIKITSIKDEYMKICNKIGLKLNTKHTLTTPQIKILKNYMTFNFIYVCYAPSVETVSQGEEWTNKTSIQIFNEETKTYDKIDGIKYYQKLAGILQREDDTITTIIKPLNDDIEYYNIIKNDNKEIYKLSNGLIKIEEKKNIIKSYFHWFYFINSYCKCHILDVLFNLNNNIDDVFAVKVDAIVLKKGSIKNLIYNNEVFNIKTDKEGNTISNVEFIKNKASSTIWDPRNDNSSGQYGMAPPFQLNDVIDINDNNEYVNNMNNLLKNPLDDNIDIIDNDEIYTQYTDINNDINDDNIDDDNTYNNINSFFGYIYNDTQTDITIDTNFIYTKDILLNKSILLNGEGGTGKTSSVMRSNFNKKNICYVASCWNLIQRKKKEQPDIIGVSWNSLIGHKCDKYKNNNIKYILIDEITLINKWVIDKTMLLYPYCIIFLIGDVTEKLYYQCSLNDIEVIKPSHYPYLQTITYTENFRFKTKEHKRRIYYIRKKMEELVDREEKIKNEDLDEPFNKLFHIKNYCLTLYKDNIIDINDITFNPEDVGISSLDEMKIEEEDRITTHFINKGTKPQYFIKKTVKDAGQLRGQQLDDKPDHNNYEMKLFKTIHSFQGLELDDNNKIVIDMRFNFDFQLFYTALSRARREDQIIIIKDDKTKPKPRRIPTPPKKTNNKKNKEQEQEQDEEEEI